MSSSSRGISRVARSLASSTPKSQHVCLSCRQTLARRNYASAATAQATVETPPATQLNPDSPPATQLPQPQYTIKAGIVLSRPPLITPDLHPFETAFYLYQRRLNERLVLPFTQYFYYKRGTPSFEHWRTKRRERNGVAARDIGPYNAYTKESWNDEVLIGNRDGEPDMIVKKLIDEEGRAEEFANKLEGEDLAMAGLRRRTEADEKNDQRSLERALSRTLYLLVKMKAGNSHEKAKSFWSFPSAPVAEKEGLKEAAQRVLGASCGVNMNTWFVGSHPVGHHVLLDSKINESKEADDLHLRGQKTFFMKARIMAGQANVTGNDMGVEDFMWLAKDEIKKAVHPEYWSRVKNMLVEQ